MFNLIVRPLDLSQGQGSMPQQRVFEYTDPDILDQYCNSGKINSQRLLSIPCLFMNEGTGDEVARIGKINSMQISGHDLSFEFSLDADVPPMNNAFIFANRKVLSITDDFEFSRNHWAIKDVDLYKFVLRNLRPRRQLPTVFSIAEHEKIEQSLASAMMPFNAEFDGAYEAIQDAAHNVGLECRRADNFWESPAIIQDVVTLIDRSRIVVCDCTNRNPNVFYETGIAHTLGREVILITQSEHDIPFDLRHLRHVRYHNNSEGLAKLTSELSSRMTTLLR